MQCIHCILFALVLVLKHINSRKEFRLQCARFQNEWQFISQTKSCYCAATAAARSSGKSTISMTRLLFEDAVAASLCCFEPCRSDWN